MATKKTVKKEEATEAGSSSNGSTSVYEVALDELKAVANNDAQLRKVESGGLKEARGQDVLRLHTTLKAIDETHRNLASDIASLRTTTGNNFDTTWTTVGEKFDETWKTVNKEFETTRDLVEKDFDKTWKAISTNFEKTTETMESDFDKTWKAIDAKFDKTWESIGQNFDATNERTKREVHDLREELTKVLDRRFTHIDQTFASIRADIEVLKALQMELIKERIGRPELLKR
jgi:hypothetical protein